MTEQYFVLMSVSGIKQSKHPLNPDYQIVVFQDMTTRKQYHTYVGIGLENNGQWHTVLSKQWGIYTGLKVKNGNLIDGDSEPRLAATLTHEETKTYRIFGTIDKPVTSSYWGNDLFKFGA